MTFGSTAFSGFAVPDIDAARAFYRDVLGLGVVDDEMGFLTLVFGDDSTVMVYPKPDHVPATYTVLNFPVADVAAAVDDLVARGVEFERYDGLPHDDAGVVRGWGPDIAWFTDPAGNIFAVLAAD